MSDYTPDKWTIIRINSQEHGTIDKVLGSWYGGFGGSDSWRMNSGIESVVEHEDCYDVIGFSGSVYHCRKGTQGMSAYTNIVYNNLSTELENSGMGTMQEITIEELLTARKS